MNLKYILTTCPYCGCGCGIYLKVKNGRLIGAVPAKNHPVSQGRVCVKGLNCWEIVEHAERIREPLIKSNGSFARAGWDEAFDVVARRIGEIKAKYGPDSIGVWGSARCTNELNYLAQKFARAVIGTNNVDHCARTCHSPTVAGLIRSFGSGAMTNSIDEIKDAAGIFIIGSNASEAHPLIGWRIRSAKDRGAKIIVCDPRRTEIAEYADIHLQHYPGTDIALLNGLMNVIISEGLEDNAFIAERTEDFDVLWSVVEKYTPERSAEITGVSAELIREAGRLYASLKPLSNIYTLGITEHSTGTENVISVANLAMLTGNVGKESSGVNPLRGQCNVQGACDMGVLPNVYPGYQKVDDEGVRQKFEKVWGVNLSSNPGLTITDQIIAAREGKIKALYIIGEDPLRSDPNITEVKKALENLEFLVVHELFMSPTAEIADVVLPGASFAEKEGTFTNSERRVQMVRKAVEPIGSSKADWEIVSEIAVRMQNKQSSPPGCGLGYGSTSEVMDEMASLSPIYGGISHGRLQSAEALQWPCQDKDHPGTQYLHKEKFSRGKGKFYGIEDKRPAEVQDEEYPFILTTGRMRFHYNVGTMTTRTELLNREFPDMFVELNPLDAKRLGIGKRTECKVSTRRGSLKVRAKVCEGIKQGVLWMPFHYADKPANLLTNDAFCPIARTGEYKACAAKVESV